MQLRPKRAEPHQDINSERKCTPCARIRRADDGQIWRDCANIYLMVRFSTSRMRRFALVALLLALLNALVPLAALAHVSSEWPVKAGSVSVTGDHVLQPSTLAPATPWTLICGADRSQTPAGSPSDAPSGDALHHLQSHCCCTAALSQAFIPASATQTIALLQALAIRVPLSPSAPPPSTIPRSRAAAPRAPPHART